MHTKSELAIHLSRLGLLEKPSASTEQYPTDSEIAAEVLWYAFMSGDINKRIVCDLGCGTGILGIGALLLGARFVYFVDNDAHSISILMDNLKMSLLDKKNYAVHQCDVNSFSEKCDVVIQNPPFGTKTKHADMVFLKKAFETASIVYSFHKTSTKEHVINQAKKLGFNLSFCMDFNFPLKKTQRFHTRRIHRIEVSCFRFVRL